MYSFLVYTKSFLYYSVIYSVLLIVFCEIIMSSVLFVLSNYFFVYSIYAYSLDIYIAFYHTFVLCIFRYAIYHTIFICNDLCCYGFWKSLRSLRFIGIKRKWAHTHAHALSHTYAGPTNHLHTHTHTLAYTCTGRWMCMAGLYLFFTRN